MVKKLFPGVYLLGKSVATKALFDRSVYGEEIRKGYRIWDPYRSKLAAAISKGLREFPLQKNSNVLYLGASTGTTPSHISDIVTEGHIYALEFSEVSMRKLLRLSKERENMSPLLKDARRPSDYEYLVGDVDLIYQDVAQKDQSEILLKNARVFLKSGDLCILCIKARSIDTVKAPSEVFGDEEKRLGKDFDILEKKELSPYDKDHRFYVLRFRGA